jgi:hypothetical protein
MKPSSIPKGWLWDGDKLIPDPNYGLDRAYQRAQRMRADCARNPKKYAKRKLYFPDAANVDWDKLTEKEKERFRRAARQIVL